MDLIWSGILENLQWADSALLASIGSAALFCATMTMTPGPNNVLLTNSGALHGVARTLPHIIGIRLGSTSLHLGILFGLGTLFAAAPWLHLALKYIAIAYLIYLAAKIAASPTTSHAGVDVRGPMTLMEAALFQWVNPKSWMATVTLCSAFTLVGEQYWPSAIAGVLVFNLVGFPASFTWVTLGAVIGKKLDSERRRRGFNLSMGCLLLLTIPMLIR
jgi:threonine/homoserine/homoserine lactone efflux protein